MKALRNQDYKTLREATNCLIQIGHDIGPFLPWHHSTDGFHWLVAECLLRRTTRSAAEKAYSSLIGTYTSWYSLADAPAQDIKAHIGWIGLGQQRSSQLKKLAEIIVERYGCSTPRTRKSLKGLPGIGDYIADAILLYVHRIKAFPIDPNIQRVMRRILGRPTSIGTRHSTPYKDPLLTDFSSYVRRKYLVDDLIKLHRGLLSVSWDVCRPKPKCVACTLNSICTFCKRLDKSSGKSEAA